MASNEWESICKQCGKCCYRLKEDGTRSTELHCEWLDLRTKRCSIYKERFQYAPNCRELIPICMSKYLAGFLPEDCGYIEAHKRREI